MNPVEATTLRLESSIDLCRARSSDRVTFTRPRRTLAISLTGRWCALNCAHCGGHYLRGMVDIRRADAAGRTSCLISGGCDLDGRVPVTSCMGHVARLRPGRMMNWHVGCISEDDMRQIAPFADVISFDFVGDDATIREVYGLPHTVDEYVHTYTLIRHFVPVVPHLTLGLRGGRFSGEHSAVERLVQLEPEALVLLVLIPTRGTRYSGCCPPLLSEVASFFRFARASLPTTPLYLGCMRPGGAYRRELDRLAVDAGLDKIVNPAPTALRAAHSLGLAVKWEDECCVIHRP